MLDKKVTFRLADQEEPLEAQIVPLFHNQTPDLTAFPTEQRIRSKKIDADLKARGEVRVIKRKVQDVEQHFDDCGGDMGPLLWLDAIPESWEDDYTA
eukprot:13539073-Heterocapsa_arctica.AAC.1